MKTLIIGGSHGLGWETAKLLLAQGDVVTVTGRTTPDEDIVGIEFLTLDLSGAKFVAELQKVINQVGRVDRLLYSAGYFQEGHVTDLSPEQIQEMIQVCGSGFILASREILLAQDELAEAIVVTSSSQWTPREKELIYNFAKAGVAHFARGLSLDPRVGKVLVFGPTGMKTKFQEGRDIDMSTYHDPAWAAARLIEEMQGDYEFRFVKLLRDPAAIEVAEERPKV